MSKPTSVDTFGSLGDPSSDLHTGPAVADDRESYDDGTCNCSRYMTCRYCTCPCGVTLTSDGQCPACEIDKAESNYDDAFMDSFYRTTSRHEGAE